MGNNIPRSYTERWITRLDLPGIAPRPYERRTHQGRFSDRAMAYHERQNALRLLIGAWAIDHLPNPLEPYTWRISLGVQVTLAPVRAPTVRGKWRETHPAQTMDIDTLAKAVADACQGILFANDRQVWGILESWKREGETDHTTILWRQFDYE